MKKLIALVFVLVSAAIAQNAPLPTLPFSFTANAIALPSGHTFAGVDSGISFSPNEYVTIADHNIISADGTLNYFGAGLDYNFPVLSTKINNMEPALSGFRFLFAIGGSVGDARVNLASVTTSKWGGEAHGSFSYALSSTGAWQLGVRAGAGRFPYYQRGWVPIIALGPSFHF